ncbi:MAG: cytochrome b/b6 domain-containing protein [Betaproteobacteria bacterium]|nr:cytochrome b/b6 domain-containing protein [Betaproteobacteria bacterium]
MSAAPTPSRTLVWDAPVRVVHWLLAFSVLGAFLTAESERWRLVHATLGYSAGGLVAFRLLWGVFGTRHARFREFVRGPAAVLRYFASLVGPRPEHHVGHNPAGALAILALLALTAVAALSGHLVYEDIGGEWLESLHEFIGESMMVLVGIHVAAVLLSSLLHRENLVGAMFSGRKAALQAQGIRSAHRILAALVAAAVLGFWAIQWIDARPGGAGAAPPAVERAAAAARPGRD